MRLWTWLRSLFARDDETGATTGTNKPLISLVLLLRKPQALDDQALADMIQQAWGIEMRLHDPKAIDFVVGVAPTFMIACRGQHFSVHNFKIPYVKDVAAEAQSIIDFKAREAFREHKAWIAVDLLWEERPERLPEVYGQLGKLIAELAGEDCTALYCPATKKIVPYDDWIAEQLRGADVLEVFHRLLRVPVVSITDDDPAMEAAVEEARRRWPEFVAAFDKRRPEQNFAVRARFSDGQNTETMWAAVTELEDDVVILGTLENEPVNVKMKYGSRVRVSSRELNDWIISGRDGLKGGFTIKILDELHKGRGGPRNHERRFP